MSVSELLDAARALPRDEQLQLAHALLDAPMLPTAVPSTTDNTLLATMFPPGMGPIEIWSQYDAHGAAVVLQQLLAESERR